MRIQLHRRIHDRTSIQRPFAGPGSSASPSSPARAMVGAKGRRRGTVLADLAAEGDRNRVVIPLLRRAAGEAESVIGLTDSRSRVCAVGRDEWAAGGALATGSMPANCCDCAYRIHSPITVIRHELRLRCCVYGAMRGAARSAMKLVQNDRRSSERHGRCNNGI